MQEAGAREDLARLYARSAPSLRRLVGGWMRMPDDVLDDACQVAWLRYLSDGRGVAGPAVLSWLARTAAREAYRTVGRWEQEISLEALQSDGPEPGKISDARLTDDPADGLLAHLTRTETLRRCTPRQRRMMWLQASGLSYAEIGRATGDSPRTVERQLVRARKRLAAGEDREAASPSGAPGRACAAGARPG